MKSVLDFQVCVGCGVCVTVCPVAILKTAVDARGFLVVQADNTESCTQCGRCVHVCPFSDSRRVADRGDDSHAEVPSDHLIGPCVACYAGYAADPVVRLEGASGGLAGLTAAWILDKGVVDAVYAVRSRTDPEEDRLFSYDRFTESNDLLQRARGSAYYQVSVAEALSDASRREGRCAFTVLPCFAMAIRRAQRFLGLTGDREPFLIGLTCGMVKSELFAQYVSMKAGAGDNPDEVRFRVKVEGQPSSNFAMRAIRGDRVGEVRWSDVARVWLSGAFTPSACWRCGDVFATEADIVFMDAWLPEYTSDWQGTNLVIARTREADELLKSMAKMDQAVMSRASKCSLARSQAAVIRRKAQMSDPLTSRTRFSLRGASPEHWLFRVVQSRMRTISTESAKMWRSVRKDVKSFDTWMWIQWTPARVAEFLARVCAKVRRLTHHD